MAWLVNQVELPCVPRLLTAQYLTSRISLLPRKKKPRNLRGSNTGSAGARVKSPRSVKTNVSAVGMLASSCLARSQAAQKFTMQTASTSPRGLQVGAHVQFKKDFPSSSPETCASFLHGEGNGNCQSISFALIIILSHGDNKAMP